MVFVVLVVLPLGVVVLVVLVPADGNVEGVAPGLDRTEVGIPKDAGRLAVDEGGRIGKALRARADRLFGLAAAGPGHLAGARSQRRPPSS